MSAQDEANTQVMEAMFIANDMRTRMMLSAVLKLLGLDDAISSRKMRDLLAEIPPIEKLADAVLEARLEGADITYKELLIRVKTEHDKEGEH